MRRLELMASLTFTSLQTCLSFAAFFTMSRSVTIPASEPFSMTRSAPILHSAICFAASSRVRSLMMLKHSIPLILVPSRILHKDHCRRAVEQVRELGIRSVREQGPYEYEMEVVHPVADAHVLKSHPPREHSRGADADNDGEEYPIEVRTHPGLAGLDDPVEQDDGDPCSERYRAHQGQDLHGIVVRIGRLTEMERTELLDAEEFMTIQVGNGPHGDELQPGKRIEQQQVAPLPQPVHVAVGEFRMRQDLGHRCDDAALQVSA